MKAGAAAAIGSACPRDLAAEKQGAASTDPDNGKEGCSPGGIPGGF